jgi:transposase
MSKRATDVTLGTEERAVLESWVRAASTEQRMALRARIVLRAAAGESTAAIARGLAVRAATVSKWRTRFVRQRLAGLHDAPRPGKPARYTQETERRVLAMLDQPPVTGYASWNGSLLAEALGDVSADHVWRVLRRHRISLQRRHSWCVSTDPEFARKAADIVGLYLDPPEHAVVICIDEKPHIQALERAQGYLRFPDGNTLTGFAHEYKRHGTSTLFAALEVATGLVKAGHYQRRRRREFLDFMNDVVADYGADTELHVILDNLNTHKPKQDRWLARHPNVHFHFTPTKACWLNQVEIWFSLLARYALKGASFRSVRELRAAIDRFIVAHTEQAAPFEWRKQTVHAASLKRSYADLYR